MFPFATNDGSDYAQLADQPQIHELIAPQTAAAIGAPSAVAMPGNPRAQVPAAANGAAAPDRVQQAMALIAPLFAIGSALGGSPRTGSAFLGGYEHGRAVQDERAQRAAQLEIQRRQQSRLEMEQARIPAAQEANRIALERERD